MLERSLASKDAEGLEGRLLDVGSPSVVVCTAYYRIVVKSALMPQAEEIQSRRLRGLEHCEGNLAQRQWATDNRYAELRVNLIYMDEVVHNLKHVALHYLLKAARQWLN